GCFAQDGAVRAAGILDIVKAIMIAPESGERLSHGAATGATAGDQSPVDVEEVESAVLHTYSTGRPARTQASVPPSTLKMSLKLSAAANSQARALRGPFWQMKMSSLSVASSFLCATIERWGMLMAPGTWPPAYSPGVRVSIICASPESIFCFASDTSIRVKG